jgi:hypothetical protein
MLRRLQILAVATTLGVLLTGCMVSESKPQPKFSAVQAVTQIEQGQLLDVAVREFDANVPAAIAKDDEALAKKRIYPDVRKAEATLIPSLLRNTLEGSSQWGAVRVVPQSVQFMDVLVTGRILESTGAHLALEIHVEDSAGRVWINQRKYESDADTGSYKTDASLRARDPFQNIYAQIANDMVVQRDLLSGVERKEIRRVTALRFGEDIAPGALSGYLGKDEKTGIAHVTRLPATDDPVNRRVESIRERDATVVDTVDGYYAAFSEKLRDSYGSWRRASFDAIEKEDRARSQARTRTVLGAAAVLASIFVPSQCSSSSVNCSRIEDAARYAGAIGGTAAVLSGIKKYGEAKTYATAVKELASTFQNEVAPQVIELQGRTLKLTGTAEEQYREWRRLLGEIYREEAGGVAQPAGAAPTEAPASMPAPAPAASAPPKP